MTRHLAIVAKSQPDLIRHDRPPGEGMKTEEIPLARGGTMGVLQAVVPHRSDGD